VVPQVLRQVDRGHPPAPELALERVAVGQRDLETTYGVRQVDSPARSYGSRVAPGSRWGQRIPGSTDGGDSGQEQTT
jgi:hypothetical protein